MPGKAEAAVNSSSISGSERSSSAATDCEVFSLESTRENIAGALANSHVIQSRAMFLVPMQMPSLSTCAHLLLVA